jgi:hypothetical protein
VPGDEVEVGIRGLGVLRNVVVAADTHGVPEPEHGHDARERRRMKWHSS